MEPLAAGLLGTWLLAFVVASVRVKEFPITSSDFQDYCFATLSFQNRAWELWPSQRTVLSGVLSGLLAPYFGILGALVHATVLSTLALMVVLFLWARAVGGRWAGWLTIAWAPCCAPLVLLSRTVSFYPAVALLQAFAAAAVAGAIARGTWPWLLASAAGMYLLPLADLRSVTLVVALLPGAVLAGLLAPKRPWWWRLLAAALPVVTVGLAWETGRWAYPASPASLQMAVQRYAEDAGRLAGVSWQLPAMPRESEFWWGRGSPTRVFDAMRYLAAVDASRPERLSFLVASAGVAPELHALKLPAGLLAAAAILYTVRRPRRLLALVVSAVPFFLLLRSALLTLPHPRQLALGAVSLPVVAGVGSAGLVALLVWGFRRFAPRWPLLRHRALPAVLGVTVTAFVVLINSGWVGGSYAPTASWRRDLTADEEPRASISEALGGTPGGDPHLCSVPLRRDAANGFSLVVPWFGAIRNTSTTDPGIAR